MATGEQQVEVDGRTLKLSNLEKVFYPSTGTTKGEVIDYYRRIAGVMIPQATRRPATRKRWVDGVGTEKNPGKVFFRKDLEDHAPDWVPRADLEHSDGVSTYPLVDETAVLAWLAQLAALEIHTPQWRFDEDLEPANPDRLVLDLDPGKGAGLSDCAQVAQWCREILADMDLEAYPLTSGSKGIHLYAPLDGTSTAEEVTEVAHELARALAQDHADDVVSDMKKSLRTGKVLVDWSQNNGHKTTVCPYSLRGRVRPTVAAPRTWEELGDPHLAQLEFEEVLERVEDGQDPIAPLGLGSDEDAPAAAKARDRLEVYRSKRDPERTPEPVPGTEDDGEAAQDAHEALEAEEPMFVIQEHHASSLHWDFRLEHDGVLVSWAVPKGPPLEVDVNRLAVQTEDHPLEYGTFEGSIPKDEYGGGDVTIWDTGTLEIEKWREGEEVIAVFHGREDGGLGGVPRRFAFLHTGGMGGARKTAAAKEKAASNWLLHLMKDQPGADGTGTSDGTAADPAPLGEPITPMLATLGSRQDIRDQDEWAFEMKWDGVRVIAAVTPNALRLTSRNGKDMTATFPELDGLREAVDPEVLAAGETVLDGEIVALDGKDRPSFSRLQQRLGLTQERDVERARKDVEVQMMVFDLLVRGGESLLRTPYRQRRDALFETVGTAEHVQLPHADHGDVDHAIELSHRLQLEGVMAKTETGIYRPGKRARTWIKIKNARHQEVVVIGWRHGKGGRSGTIGSLLLAVPDAEGTLHYAGRVGTGFSDQDLEDIATRLRSRSRKTPPVDDVPAADRRDAEWVRADLVGEVQHTERTEDGRLRHPVWRGWRPDKDVEDVRAEE
ncbi:ATP-dependent DNA ligase [Brachybacterium sacelli]|uniref:DNA ligase (ATP) n=1 Tax=Brachybacterium sacelli TaxID=173364 RepID=A0ABS4WZZ3_9MICO|nr:ATP-dependent DNA ligase [Brachybacterium sacelli]MBP2381786.1 bifunctional non-homologous end joining protein LigD [Brachybacterium sacelli]